MGAIATPKATETWYPIPHTVLLDQVEETLQHNGLKIVNQAHVRKQVQCLPTAVPCHQRDRGRMLFVELGYCIHLGGSMSNVAASRTVASHLRPEAVGANACR